MKNKINWLTIVYLFIGIIIQFIFQGCVTQLVHKSIEEKPHYHPEQYPTQITGSYCGKFSHDNKNYSHYYFHHFPWPDQYGQSMHIFIPDMETQEPIIYNAPRNLYANEFPPIEEELLDLYYTRGPGNVVFF